MRSSTFGLAALAVGIVLAGCARKPEVTGSIGAPSDYRDRHPIVMQAGHFEIGVYPIRGPGGLDRRQRDDLADFVETYRERGRGHITIAAPDPATPEIRQTLAQVRAGFKEMLVPASYVRAATYPGTAGAVSPVKLSFERIEADVAGDCGKWTEDALGQGRPNFENRPYDNFGCAYQRHIAVQVADPVDLARPRRLGPADIARQLRAIEAYRTGTTETLEADSTGG
jgi:pilus assembly protein CpaD